MRKILRGHQQTSSDLREGSSESSLEDVSLRLEGSDSLVEGIGTRAASQGGTLLGGSL